MDKIKCIQRDREIWVYPWALVLAEDIIAGTAFNRMVQPGTDIKLYWAEAATQVYVAAHSKES